jgi:MFS family permease
MAGVRAAFPPRGWSFLTESMDTHNVVFLAKVLHGFPSTGTGTLLYPMIHFLRRRMYSTFLCFRGGAGVASTSPSCVAAAASLFPGERRTSQHRRRRHAAAAAAAHNATSAVAATAAAAAVLVGTVPELRPVPARRHHRRRGVRGTSKY